MRGARSHWSTWSGHVHRSSHGLWSWCSHTSSLCWPSGLSSDLSWEESLRLWHGGHEVTTHSHLLHTSHTLHSHASHSLDILTGQVSFTVFLPLGQSNIQWLGHNDTSIHLRDSLSGLLRG